MAGDRVKKRANLVVSYRLNVNYGECVWDMICDMRDGSQLWVKGELFYENRRFLVS